MKQVVPVVMHPNVLSPYQTVYESIGEPLSLAAVDDTVTLPLPAGRPSASSTVTSVGAPGAAIGGASGVTTGVVAALPLPTALCAVTTKE